MPDVTIAIPAGPLLGFAAWLMPPVAEFGCPVQRGKHDGESFWHIPVQIFPRLWKKIGPATISPCKVYMDRYSGDQKTDSIQLGWGDMHFEDGKAEELLQKGRVVLVPIVWRSELGDDTNAYIADLNFLRDRSQLVRSIAGDRKKNKFKLRVKSGASWEKTSAHLYMIRVPDAQSNGQFSVEMEYEGEGTQGL